MHARLRLEAFDPAPTEPAPAVDRTDDALEDLRLAAYEKGYAAGWEDAIASQADDQRRIREDLAENLRNLSFTYWEARTHLLHGFEPLLKAMVDRVLPQIARATLGAAVVAEVQAEAARLDAPPAVVEIAPADRAAVEAALGADPALPVALRDNPTLAPGQVHFRFGAAEERALDLSSVVTAIGALVTDFLQTMHSSDERSTRHG